MFHPAGTPPRSPRKDGSFFSSGQPEYRGTSTSVNLKSSSSTSSLVSPSKSRRIRAAVKNLKIRADPSSMHSSMENVQSGPYGLAQSYINETMQSPLQSPIHRKPPTIQGALNSRSSSVSSLGSNRDRSLERSRESPFRNRDYPNNHVRDRSLDRQTDMHYRSYNDTDGYHTFGGRERSRDREYPFMGARSLEREHTTNLHRSKSIDQEYLASHSHYLPNQPDYIHTRETLILDLQSQIADLNKECAILQQNLDTTKEKLSSSMNSIKTFWSPELKKERMLRKEENAKTVSFSERLKTGQQAKEKLVLQLREAEKQLKLVQGQSPDALSPSSHTSSTSQDLAVAAVKKDRQTKEILLLRKTIEEMELRIETQKQTLSARDESIKKLLEMLQSKGLCATDYEHDQAHIDRLREKTLTDDRKIGQLENLLEQRDKEISFLAEEVENYRVRGKYPEYEDPLMKRNSVDLLTLEAMVETKDCKIESMQSEIETLRFELDQYKCGTDSNVSTPHSVRSIASSQDAAAWASTEKYLKSKIDNLKAELGRKDTELCGLNTQIESVKTQAADKQQLITLLREQIQAKEQQCAHIQHDLDSLRERLEEKEAQLGVKSRNLLNAHTEHQQVCNQLTELRDHIDIKERKAAVAHKKVEHIEEVLREKDEQLRSVQSRLNAIQTDRSNRDTALESLQTTITDQTRQIDKFKEKLDRRETDHQEEVDILQATIRELKNKVTSCEAQISDKQREGAEIKEANTELKKEKLRREAHMKELREELYKKTHELKRLEEQVSQVASLKDGSVELSNEISGLKNSHIELKKEKVRRDAFIKELKDELQSRSQQVHALEENVQQLQAAHTADGTQKHEKLQELEGELGDLKREVSHRDGEVSRTQTEVDRLLDILRTTENEKNEKDKQIKDLHDQIKDYKQKLGNTKKNHQTEKNSQQQVLEEARKNASEDTAQLKSLLTMREERVEELEEALRESVRITAHREMVLHDLDIKVKKAEIQMRTKNLDVEDMRERCKEAGEEVCQLRDRLAEKGEELQVLSSERNKYILEAYDMKQEAILAAITEKDAHIAVIEMTPNLPTSQTVPEVEKLTHQKHELQRKLKELTEDRMKVILREEKNKALVTKQQHTQQSQPIEKSNGQKRDIWT